MTELLNESLGAGEREAIHGHIELCPGCQTEWRDLRTTWALLGDLPDVELPPRIRARFLDHVDLVAGDAKVIVFRPKIAMRWLAQAAAVILLCGAAYLAGSRQFFNPGASSVAPPPAATSYSLAESQVIQAAAMNPEIEGRPQIQNVQFTQNEGDSGDISVSFDLTSHVTVTGKPHDRSLVKLLSYVLQNQNHQTLARSKAIDWVRDTYRETGTADPEIVTALANVLKNDTHEGVRIKAVETLQSFPAPLAPEARAALIGALQNDPNPAVRIKAVEALARLAQSGEQFDPAAVEMLRKTAAQPDENTYVRVKAAEALGRINL